MGRDVPGGIIFHDLRRTVKTNMVNAGVDQVHRDIILGHSLHGMDVRYMAPSEDDLHRAMARYTEWLDGTVEFCKVLTIPLTKTKKPKSAKSVTP